MAALGLPRPLGPPVRLSRERRVNVMVGTFERWGCPPNAPVLLIVEVAKPQVLAARTLS
jgi:hypothetical protein